MLLFKTKALILKLHKVNENDFLYTLFSAEYGKIICQKQKNSREKSLDIGYIINCEVETKEDRKIHKIRNIKILHEFQTEKKSFGEINSYLESIALILKNIPEGVPNIQIIELYSKLYILNNFSEEKMLILKLKLLHIFGILSAENNNLTIKKILNFIINSPGSECLKLTGISPENKKILEEFF